MKPTLLKLASLNGNLERKYAYLTALTLSDGNYELFGLYVALYGNKNLPRFLRLVADALEEKPSKFDLTPTGLLIIEAWHTACCEGARRESRRQGGTGMDVSALICGPTLLEIKTQYAIAHEQKPPLDHAKRRGWIAELERDKKIPSDQTFRKTLKRVKRPYR